MSGAWVRPFEREPGPSGGEAAAERPLPSVLAEAGDPRFLDLLARGERPDDEAPPVAAIASAERLKRRTTRTRRRALKWLLGSLALLVAGLLALDAAAFLDGLFERSLALGVVFSVLIAAVVVALLVAVREEVADLRRLQVIQHLRDEAERLMRGSGAGTAAGLTTHIAALYRGRADVAPGLEAFRLAVPDAHADAEVLALFTDRVLRPLDDRAYRVVVKYASQAGLASAVSPLALLDALLNLWRSTRMVREIAALYGGRPGPSGSLALLRGVLGSLVAAGGSEIAADIGTEALGGSVVAALSARAGQGVAVGLFTARVGLVAMRLCRPVPFRADEQPRLATLRGELVKAIRSAMSGGAA